MTFTTPLQKDAIKIMLLGSGELGKEVAIEAQRLGVEVIAVDKYENAPAHLVANRSYVIDMKDEDAVLALIEEEKPTYILPEVEAISISTLFEAQKRGFHVIPNAEAVNKTMNRKNIRLFAAEELGLKTSAYEFVSTFDGLKSAGGRIGFPCVIKPVMSSSGHGQSIAKTVDDLEKSWEIAKEARGDASELIVEAFVDFDYEITLLTVRNELGTVFCDAIGHVQKEGDFILSWQPMDMPKATLQKAKDIAKKVTDGLGGRGIFGVEFFVKDNEVYFSELSPRPHDTGMVTLITQSQSQFALHIRAVLGLPLEYTSYGSGACAAYKAKNESQNPVLEVPDSAFTKDSFVRIFGKPESHVGRRMAVSLVLDDVEVAKERATEIVNQISDK
ncbi:MAG: formate-dependent phosphoribosylglycinamide formyltransferase [Sulfurovum sp.]|nr:formate-dependent phosphoribosylglycinamide formyltransferase [Sulfurovum sp.]